MSDFVEDPYEEGFEDSINYQKTESYGGSERFGSENFGGSENVGGSERFGAAESYEGTKRFSSTESYGQSGNYRGMTENEGGYKVAAGMRDLNASRHEAFLKRKQARIENTKMNYESWENDKEWRPFTIIPRDWWRAIPPSHSAPLIHPVDLIVMTYSHGNTCWNTYFCNREVKRIQSNHVQNGAVDIVFNFLIGGNGQVYEGRGWNSSPRLNHKLQRFSRNALHIAFLGNLRATMPPQKMFNAARDLVELGIRKHFIAPKFLEYTSRLWSIPGTPTDSDVLKDLQAY
ncbi:peptidoglycan-recognition protein SB1-like [Macrosteles quadrilineatus]|uniref:peptidoglycan-recognition protein SB1-like n=1 Tax=Macrosteles quadrilineatus TaxID=74068 RepID=UPI0023E29C39|nr:peptidoglycan-recognition protein SB1-like [Macrosteles quadrilineatus]